MLRPVIAGVVCLWAQAAPAQGVQIELFGPSEEDVTAESTIVTEPPAESAVAVEADAPLPEGFEAKLDYGHGLYLKGDYDGALKVYTAARDSRSTDPLPFYFIACAAVKLEKFEDAETALSALAAMCGEKLPSLHARGMFLAAVIAELKGDKDAAVAAWSDYKTFAQAHSSAPVFPATADARLAAFEKVRALDEQYQVVRERINGGQ